MKLKNSLLAVGLLLTALGCGNSNEETNQEKILNIGDGTELSTMDSTIATDVISYRAIATTIEGLVLLDKDGNIIPGIAESYSISEDKKTYTFNLREAYWNNGTPVKAEDFVFAWRKLVDPDNGSEMAYKGSVAGIKNAEDIMYGKKPLDSLGVVALDSKTLKVELDKPIPYFLQMITSPAFSPISEEFYNQQKDQYGIKPESVLANGPFKMVEWNQGANYLMVKNDKYYDSQNVKIDKINFQVIKDVQSGIIAYEQGDIDTIILTGDLVDMYKDSKDYTNIPDSGLYYIVPNLQVKGLENINLRKAIALAFDKKEIADNILKNGSLPAYYVVTKGLANGPDGKDFRSTAPEYQVTNKEKAKEYFEKAKQELKQDKFEYEFVFTDKEESKKIAEFFKSEIETTLPGIIINLKQVPTKESYNLLDTRNFQIELTGWKPDYPDPLVYLDMWTTGASYNYGEWSNVEYDKLIYESSKGSYLLDLDKRWKALQKAEEILMEEAVVFPVYEKGSVGLVRDGVVGIEFHSIGTTIYKNVDINRENK